MGPMILCAVYIYSEFVLSFLPSAFLLFFLLLLSQPTFIQVLVSRFGRENETVFKVE